LSRYFFYPVYLCMAINAIFYVPKLLLQERFDGSIMAMLISLFLGWLLAVMFTRGMGRFPGLGLPEILEQTVPAALRMFLLLFLGLMWVAAGSIVIVAFTLIIKQVLSPDISRTLLLFGSIIIICWAATRTSYAIMNVLEIGLLLSMPFTAFIIMKTMSSPFMDWDAVLSMTDYIFRVPSWNAIALSTYLFTGYVNMAIFNRIFKDTRIKRLWLIPIAGLVISFTSFIVPIGIHGTQSVEYYTYTWISTADSIIMQFGFIERLLYVFLVLYIMLALLFVTVAWHVGVELIRPCFSRLLTRKRNRTALLNWMMTGVFGIGTYIYGTYTNEKALINMTQLWMNIRLPVEMILVALVVYLGRRKRNA
jgi:hypothetical protein